MKNRIRGIDWENHALSPTLAEVWFTIYTEHLTATTEIRGRLMGPCCLYATTVEVAYPLRPVHEVAGQSNALTVRAVIPEPNLWDPECPFGYRAAVELWQDGEQCDQAWFDYGLRTFQPSARGLMWNGKALTLKGTACLPTTREEVLRLRQAGYNLLLTSLPDHSLWWTAANRLGFLMLGSLPPLEQEVRLARVMGGQVCAFGWVLGSDWLKNDPQITALRTTLRVRENVIGVYLDKMTALPSSNDFSFAICSAAGLATLGGHDLPKLVMREAESVQNDYPASDRTPTTWGSIDRHITWLSRPALPPDDRYPPPC